MLPAECANTAVGGFVGSRETENLSGNTLSHAVASAYISGRLLSASRAE